MHTDVPRAVLPLEIKSPVIPLSVLALAVVNLNAFRRLRHPRALVERHGPWELVSGASAGIGAEFAHQLAAEGFNIVLVARTNAKLEELAELVGHQYRVDTRVVAVDLAGQAGIERVKGATEDIEVGLLVNSAGVATPGAFTWRSEDSVRYEYSVKAVATSLLTHHFGRRMVGRGRGAIVLVSSTFGHQPVPYFQHYTVPVAVDVSWVTSPGRRTSISNSPIPTPTSGSSSMPSGGPSLELNAQVNTVPLEHAPARLEGGVLYGRGATDMNGSLAACLEAARAVRDAGRRKPSLRSSGMRFVSS